MSRLTKSDKTELNDLITGQLEEMAEAIRSEYEPALREIKSQAEQKAIDSLGIALLVARAEEILRKRSELLIELCDIQDKQDEMLNKPADPQDWYRRHRHNESSSLSYHAQSLLPARTKHHETELLAASAFGQQLNKIERKKQNVSKDILLATMPAQLAAVWESFCEEFGLDP
tara:strand:+ start:704 stop:1222 length:519 start_codon:yes stop_codon:yes gene_type:complete